MLTDRWLGKIQPRAIWSAFLGCIRPLQKGVREVWYHWRQYVLFQAIGRHLVESHYYTDIALVGKKVVDFYKAKGGKVESPLVKAL